MSSCCQTPFTRLAKVMLALSLMLMRRLVSSYQKWYLLISAYSSGWNWCQNGLILLWGASLVKRGKHVLCTHIHHLSQFRAARTCGFHTERLLSTLFRSILNLCPQKVLRKDNLFVSIPNILCSEFHWACDELECWQLFTALFLCFRFLFLVCTAWLLEVAEEDGVFYCKSGRTWNKQNPSC